MYLTYQKIRENSKIYSDGTNSVVVYKHWRYFFSTKGGSAPFNNIDSTNSGIPDYVETILYKFETAYGLLTDSFGLNSPLEDGFFAKFGVKYIDIFMRDIPREHGIASGMVYDDIFELLNGTPYQGKSLKITVHRDLIPKTATPIHELFHIFQYSYTHFNNMWFMEGLARWSQSIMQEKRGKVEPLPKTKEELDILVHKLHDAEFFFNQLITLSEEGDSFTIPQYLQNNSEIYNNKKTGSIFMKIFLENCNKQQQLMEQTLKSRKIDNSRYWTRENKRSVNNNQYIFKAIIDTVKEVSKNPPKELSDFIELIAPLANITIKDYDTKKIQEFLKVVYKYNKDLVILDDSGIYYSEFYDIFTSTLSKKDFLFENCDIDDDELDSFRVLRRVNGNLIFNNCKNITNLNGLNSLELIGGDLVVDGSNIVKLNDLNNLQTVTNLDISNMDSLISISGLNELEKIKSTLKITNNKNLSSIKGFSSLNSITNIDILKTDLRSCNFLVEVIKHNSRFNGYIKICNSKLEDIKFLSGLKYVKSSLFLHQNRLSSVDGLELLEYVGASLSLSVNRLENIKALKNLKAINGLLALSYNRLKTLEGLENLESLVTKKWGKIYFTIKIYENRELEDISALKNIQTKDNYIVLYYDSDIEYKLKPDLNSAFHKNILELHDFKSKKLIPTYKFVSKKSHDYSNFRAATHNKLFNTMFDFEVESADILVLSFTGANGNLGGIFYNKYPVIVDGIDTHKIFIMDPLNSWYHNGFAPFTKNMDENIEFIKELVLSKKYKKVITIGTSMGAYISIVLGVALEGIIDEVLAFSPQIVLDSKNRERIGDKRWKNYIAKFPKDIKDEYLDLELLFEKYQNKTTIFNIHYATKELYDNQHIEHLKERENIKLIPYDVDDHYLTIMLHKEKKLNGIIKTHLKLN